ncbi:hypothetical protein JAAARDRAFT_186044 [Jaapia argillacea MUCL 33604]|uniref:Wax synthase domain-containing protein n=1 Tax=Jaapia argillacea MUCL 33604 TaxID=933084 RepID=A0A067P6Q4_9AGAM|nr:hypothetical protein JAAARDRAFT_186044 [Jaapia argillacea MUCL 33604]
MSLALLTLQLAQQWNSARASPIPTILAESTTPTCDTLSHCRTLSSIIYSCVATIVACTWVSIHPNIPSPDASDLWIFLTKVGHMILALIAPELLLVWAMRQWFVAGRLARKYKDHGWTRTHGFFALMGGFMLYDGQRPVHTLSPTSLEDLFRDGQIDFPTITQKEIQDRSKSDAFSKGVVVMQTVWFMVQCSVRVFHGPRPAELELMTFAFTWLSIATYIFWWAKPLNVRFPIPVQRKLPTTPAARAEEEVKWDLTSPAVGRGPGGSGATFLLFRPFFRMGVGDDIHSGAKKVPAFYAGTLRETEKHALAYRIVFIATVFGAFHCIAFSYQFPTYLEQTLWRISCIVTTVAPLLMTAAMMYVEPDWLLEVIMMIVCTGYTLARLMLLGISFSSLRALPAQAYQTVYWTQYLPHI